MEKNAYFRKKILQRQKDFNAKIMAGRIRALESSLQIAKDYAEKLEAKVRTLEKQKKMLADEERKKNESQRKSVLEGKEISLRDSLIKSLSSERERLRKRFSRIDELEMIGGDGCIPVIPIKKIDKDSILESDRIFGINGSVIFFGSKLGKGQPFPRIIITLQPKAVIAELGDDESRILRNADICAISPKNISLRKYIDFLGADREEFEREAGKNKARFF
jgi:predicted RNase H-like nuclease (RuvC/YqgF family)